MDYKLQIYIPRLLSCTSAFIPEWIIIIIIMLPGPANWMTKDFNLVPLPVVTIINLISLNLVQPTLHFWHILSKARKLEGKAYFPAASSDSITNYHRSWSLLTQNMKRNTMLEIWKKYWFLQHGISQWFLYIRQESSIANSDYLHYMMDTSIFNLMLSSDPLQTIKQIIFSLF